MNMQDDSQKMLITPAFVDDALNISAPVKEELKKLERLEFNIFTMQEKTSNNELVVTISYIMAKQNLFSKLNASFEVFRAFMTRIQGGYKNVTYHNKTHAADLS
jgi:hypothetical protein